MFFIVLIFVLLMCVKCINGSENILKEKYCYEYLIINNFWKCCVYKLV